MGAHTACISYWENSKGLHTGALRGMSEPKPPRDLGMLSRYFSDVADEGETIFTEAVASPSSRIGGSSSMFRE